MSLAALEPPLTSSADAALLVRSLRAARRRDGRALLEARAPAFSFDRGDARASAECLLGRTR